MKITLYRQPSILHEAVELVHAYVNKTPTEQLCGKSLTGITGDELQNILSLACRDINREDSEIQFFFRGVPFEDKKDGLASIARNMVYAWAEEIHHDAHDMAACLLEYWKKYRGTLRIRDIDLYAVSVCHDEQGRFHDLTQEVTKLSLPRNYQMRLVETMSCYDFYLQRLMTLLQPVLAVLPGLLMPIVQRNAQLLEQWGQFFSDIPNFQAFCLQVVAVDSRMPQELRLYLRYFQPHTGWLFFDEHCRVFNVHLGINQERSIVQSRQALRPLESCDHLILRQLSSADRMNMLTALVDTPMTAQEVARKLELHPSSVFRDLNAMSNLRLLIKEVSGGKSTYRTNYPLLQELFDTILQTIRHSAPQPGE